MKVQPSQRARGDVTRETIIEVAERLWGQQGLNSASLRQISVEAGLVNPSSVHYHFGGRDGLLLAIFQHRLPLLEQARQARITSLDKQGRSDELRSLLDCLFGPFLDLVDRFDRHSYAAYLREVLMYEPARELRTAASGSAPVTSALCDRIRNHLRLLPLALFEHRLLTATLMVLDVIVQNDRQSSTLAIDVAYSDALEMAAVGMAAPVSRTVKAALRQA